MMFADQNQILVLTMYPYQHLERSEVMDMLAKHTARLTEMMREGSCIKEYNSCKEAIENLLLEISFRDIECDMSPSLDKQNINTASHS